MHSIKYYFQSKRSLGRMGSFRTAEINVRLATQSWGEGGGVTEREREIFYYHPTTSKLGKRNVTN